MSEPQVLYAEFTVLGGRPDGGETNWKYVGPTVQNIDLLIQELREVRSYPIIELEQTLHLSDGTTRSVTIPL